jgi:hypothetical protein
MFKMNSGLKPAAARSTMPKNLRRIQTRQIVDYIQPKRGKPIPVYGTQPFDFSRYPAEKLREIERKRRETA